MLVVDVGRNPLNAGVQILGQTRIYRAQGLPCTAALPCCRPACWGPYMTGVLQHTFMHCALVLLVPWQRADTGHVSQRLLQHHTFMHRYIRAASLADLDGQSASVLTALLVH